MTENTTGFIGLGVMGAPMCGHVHAKRADAGLGEVIAYDMHARARERAAAAGIRVADTLADLMQASDQVHVCLPGGPELEALCRGGATPDAGASDGLLSLARVGQLVIDHGTSPVDLTRALASNFAERGAAFCDAPITRTRAAAEAGTLVVLFGGASDALERARPAIMTFAEQIVPCGAVGAGQVVKQMNNMVLIQTVVGIAEALATARAAGVDGDVLFSALEAGSGDSFALRHHGRKAMLPGVFPERAFATTYALKDLSYALDLARSAGLDLAGAQTAKTLLEAAIDRGDGAKYWPVVYDAIAAAEGARSTASGSPDDTDPTP
ncbi:MAG: NAD(P)-dependent oxidoreductase [Pseudomonadota bacterium]